MPCPVRGVGSRLPSADKGMSPAAQRSHVPWVCSRRSRCAPSLSLAEAGGRWYEKACEGNKATEGASENWILGTGSSRLHLDRSL